MTKNGTNWLFEGRAPQHEIVNFYDFSPASPAPRRAKIPNTIRNVVSIEPRSRKYTFYE